jgi:hypothetical protein
MSLPLRRILAAAAVLLPIFLVAPSVSAQQRDTTMVRTRVRVLGVFDRQTGEPIEGVEVRDYSNGFMALTTRTGTVALLLTDTLGTLVNIKKIGFVPQTIMLGTALKDTVPLTIDMLRTGQLLEKVIVTADGRSLKLGPNDTVQTLLDNGFYARRATSAAPADAFITGDRMRASMLLSNAHYFGRGICENNVFVDGVRFPVEKRQGLFTKEGIDAMIDPTQVAGIETYRVGDLPASTTHSFEGASALNGGGSLSAIATGLNSMTATECVTLIWLKR